MLRTLLALSLASCLAMALGCSISNSSASISKSISSPFKWSSASSDSSSPDDEKKESPEEENSGENPMLKTAYAEDVRHLTGTYAMQGGQIGAFRTAITQLALARGISNWEVDSFTSENIGQGAREGGMTQEAFDTFSKALFGEDLSKRDALRQGYDQPADGAPAQ